MSHYSTPTENAAIGRVDREWELMRKKAARIRARRLRGQLSQAELAEARKMFVGIYAKLLRDTLGSGDGEYLSNNKRAIHDAVRVVSCKY